MLSQIQNINALIKFIEDYIEIINFLKEENNKYVVYSYLLDSVVSNNHYNSTIEHWRFTFSQIIWFSFPVIVYVAMSVITISLILVSKTALLYIMATIFIILLANATFIMIKGMSKIKRNKEVVQEKFLRMQREARKNLPIIIHLRTVASKDVLKFVEQDFENENKQLQSRANFLSKLIPFLTIIIIILFLNTGIDPRILNDNDFLYNIFQGLAGLYTFLY